MDKLERIFDMQRALNEDIVRRRGLENVTYEEWMQKYALAAIAEISEMLDEVNYKWWKNKKEIDHAAVKEELVDVLHFFVSMCLKAGLTADELFNVYNAKNKENFDRQNGLSAKKGYEAGETSAS